MIDNDMLSILSRVPFAQGHVCLEKGNVYIYLLSYHLDEGVAIIKETRKCLAGRFQYLESYVSCSIGSLCYDQLLDTMSANGVKLRVPSYHKG